MNINFVSYVNLATKALPMLSESNGSIAVVSAGTSLFSLPGVIAHSASKQALNGFFEGFRLELNYKELNVSVTLLFLGGVATDHAIDLVQDRDMLAQFGDPDEAAAFIMKATSSKQTWAYYPWAAVRIPEIIHTISRDLCDIMMTNSFFPMLRMLKI
uniref:Hydroxysteroid 11-beta-dehydrogenase 1-like protein-like n=1 Tax=Saccoglossus kowalevskii TaxID=10224 RepID=A0ABM0MLU8_SACKO|nr:PREDICTED: hydroxysteroid 11-beta-dehydrogenase 1-like protein-like [Saccoglossus kowalevskii]